ncbi:hypothetical protein HDU91_002463 [Kappamyces sp. JEL0680]|nr:hypothetical protein HDU91_002463 [Kappamyces sp. JEL0680]
MSISDLLKLRLVSKKYRAMADELLFIYLEPNYLRLCVDSRQAVLVKQEVVQTRTPHLDHFRNFLIDPKTQQHLTEVIWYANAPIEVQSVCECLVRLKGGVDLPDDERMSWTEIRKVLKRTEFKLWLNSLATNVDFIDIRNTRKVENIIRLDPLITYERLREVSVAGYKFLIFVAACLQYSTNDHEIAIVREKAEKLEAALELAGRFMDCIKK